MDDYLKLGISSKYFVRSVGTRKCGQWVDATQLSRNSDNRRRLKLFVRWFTDDQQTIQLISTQMLKSKHGITKGISLPESELQNVMVRYFQRGISNKEDKRYTD